MKNETVTCNVMVQTNINDRYHEQFAYHFDRIFHKSDELSENFTR